MKSLTKAEEQVMMMLWQHGSGSLMELVAAMPKPQPHKNTVATLLKILAEKGFVNIEVLGRFHRYHAAITKEAYSARTLSGVVKDYFGGSFPDAVSFLVEKDKISIADLELLLKQLKRNSK